MAIKKQHYLFSVILSVCVAACGKKDVHPEPQIEDYPHYTANIQGMRKWRRVHYDDCIRCTPPEKDTAEFYLNFGILAVDDSTICDTALPYGGILRVSAVDSSKGIITYTGVYRKDLLLKHYFLADSIAYTHNNTRILPDISLDTCVTIK